MVYLQMQAVTLSVCLHLSRDLYRPPQAALCYTLLLCTEGLWERVTSCSTTAGLFMWVSTDVYALNGLNWCMWDLLACMVSLDVMYACDITTASAMAWWMSSLLLVWMISPLCVNICESTDLRRGLFLFCVGADRLQSQRVPIVAISFISVSLLWLVLCQLVATVIGRSGKGHDPADGSLVSA